ncbi:MAG: DUF2520 domain-containing protein [Bacteroidales bacterium]|jgi:predicted short-subunit dehydrogenase-like oxidoreductase (DUF2520 family)|nr:DUF2520 domain-containing protein [Bacteroidales bacterium]
MKSIQSLVLIGSGNVASLMAEAFKDVGLDIWGVYSKTTENAKILAEKINVNVFKSVAEIPTDADAYLLAVNESALPVLIKELEIIEGILMHTSGSVGLDVFPENVSRSAVFYPLQTFSKSRQIDFSTVPILIESKDNQILEELMVLGAKISNNVKIADSVQRKQLHLAAVFACNFSNFMFHIAEELLKENNLDFELLKPLIIETTAKLNEISPLEAQTGPAIRNNKKILNKHLKMLENHPEYQNIYRLISDQIKKLKSV